MSTRRITACCYSCCYKSILTLSTNPEPQTPNPKPQNLPKPLPLPLPLTPTLPLTLCPWPLTRARTLALTRTLTRPSQGGTSQGRAPANPGRDISLIFSTSPHISPTSRVATASISAPLAGFGVKVRIRVRVALRLGLGMRSVTGWLG